jgi:hypothetical protein
MAAGRIDVIFLSHIPASGTRTHSGTGGVSTHPVFITSPILFNGLQNGSNLNFFLVFPFLHTPISRLGCYIDFSGFTTSSLTLAQEKFLNTTCVTAGTYGGTETKNKQG